MIPEEEMVVQRLIDRESSWRPLLFLVVVFAFTFSLIHSIGELRTRLDAVEKQLEELRERSTLVPS